MKTDPLEFADRVGAELARLLGERSRAELLTLTQTEQFAAALGAALICTAEVLRDPVERGAAPTKMAALCAKQIEGLLDQVRPHRHP